MTLTCHFLRRYPCPQEGCSAAISALDTTMTPGRWEELRAGAYGAAVNPPSMQAAALGVRGDTLEVCNSLPLSRAIAPSL